MSDGTGDLLTLGRVNSGGLLGNTTNSLLSGNGLLSVTGIVGDGCAGDWSTNDGGSSLTVRSGDTGSSLGLGVERSKLALSLSCVGVVLAVSMDLRLRRELLTACRAFSAAALACSVAWCSRWCSLMAAWYSLPVSCSLLWAEEYSDYEL